MNSTIKPSEQKLILESSLQSFFFDELSEINKKFEVPLPQETIYYSSLVMDKFGESNNYFELENGRLREKTLGLKLLESTHQSRSEQQRSLKDIGDTSLLMCGFFQDSVKEKILDIKYYKEIGQIAYQRLDAFVPSFYDVNEFYKNLSSQFDSLTNLIRIVQTQKLRGVDQEEVLLIVNTNKIKAS